MNNTPSAFLPFGKPDFSGGEIEAVARVMRTGWIGMGREVEAFEDELGQALGAPHVVCVNSCTSALFLSLLVCGVGPGDEVICPALTWCSTANAALYLGAQVSLCDVDENTLSLSPETVLARLTPRTRAVMAVHMGGRAVDVAELRARLPAHVAIIEDAAHALGARYPDGRPVGSSGNLCCFSFYANKNLSTGEGGAIGTNSPEFAARLRSLRQHGQNADAWKRYQCHTSWFASRIDELGYKMNYTDLQAAIGRIQLQRQPEFAEIRHGIVQDYLKHLASPLTPLVFQDGIADGSHARHLAVARLPASSDGAVRDHLLRGLRDSGIGASLHYVPLHHHPAYQHLAHADLPVTDQLAARILTLPISASMSAADGQRVWQRTVELLDEIGA